MNKEEVVSMIDPDFYSGEQYKQIAEIIEVGHYNHVLIEEEFYLIFSARLEYFLSNSKVPCKSYMENDGSDISGSAFLPTFVKGFKKGRKKFNGNYFNKDVLLPPSSENSKSEYAIFLKRMYFEDWLPAARSFSHAVSKRHVYHNGVVHGILNALIDVFYDFPGSIEDFLDEPPTLTDSISELTGQPKKGPKKSPLGTLKSIFKTQYKKHYKAFISILLDGSIELLNEEGEWNRNASASRLVLFWDLLVKYGIITPQSKKSATEILSKTFNHYHISPQAFGKAQIRNTYQEFEKPFKKAIEQVLERINHIEK